MCINVRIKIDMILDGKRSDYGNPNNVDWIAEGIE